MEFIIRTPLARAYPRGSKTLTLLMWSHVALVGVVCPTVAWLVPAVLVAALVAGFATLAIRRRSDGVATHLTAAAVLLATAVGIAWGVGRTPGLVLAVWPAVLAFTIGSADVVAAAATVRTIVQRFALLAGVNAALETRLKRESTEITRLMGELDTLAGRIDRVTAERERATAERANAEQFVDHLSHHDAVTGLPNRELMMDRLRIALATAHDSRAQVLVLYLDLADLKAVNETTGHASGDQALAIIAARIRRCIRTGDTASRVGGDEFVIVCGAVNAATESVAIAERLIAAVAEPIHAGTIRMSLGSNIGISIAPLDGKEPDELIAFADAAMYRAKETGINTYHHYAPGVQAELLEKAALRRELETALANDEFVVHYQPIVSATADLIVGAEALVRWNHPIRGMIAPAEFIPFAERHGLIAAIGESVMRKACLQIKRFALRASDEFTMSVNVSPLQFRQEGFVERVCEIMSSADIDRSRLEIEITESVVMEEVNAATRALYALAAAGVKLSIDDFGTGYSSLSYVKKFPVQTLKIDRSFVRDLASSPTDQAIAAAIVTLAHSLGMRVVAEGIETPEQRERLRNLGVDDMQGYLISRPLPAAEFEQFVCSTGILRLAAQFSDARATP